VAGKYRVRRGLFGKSVLQKWMCFPEGISSHLSGTCDWVDVSYGKAPSELEAVEKEKASRVLEIVDSRIDYICKKLFKEDDKNA